MGYCLRRNNSNIFEFVYLFKDGSIFWLIIQVYKCIYMYVRQGFSLRGYDTVLNASNEISSRDGNFRALLRFWSEAGDAVRKKYLEASAKKSEVC